MKLQSRGIVIAASSREEAENQYRSVAKGHNVMPLVSDTDNFVVLSHHDEDGMTLMNPLTGELGLEAQASVLDQMQYVAESSAEDVETNYTVCLSGCQSHIIFDDPSLVQFCPVCASSIEDHTDEELQAHAASADESDDSEDESEDVSEDASEDVSEDASEDVSEDASEDPSADESEDESEDVSDLSAEASAHEQDDLSQTLDKQGIVVAGATLAEATAAYAAIASGEEEAVTMCDGQNTFTVAASAELSGSPFTAEASVEDDAAEPFEATAAAGDEVDVHYFVCSASDDCGAHVLASSDDVVFCPTCLAGVVDPEGVNGDTDDALEAMAGDASDADLEALTGEEEPVETEIEAVAADDSDDFEAIAGDDSDDSDEELDASDDSEDAATLSVASDVDLTTVNLELASFAGMDDELVVEHLDVAYAGSIADESSWYAYYKGMPVARATKATATATDIFDQDVFGKAVVATASENGVIPALKSMGFVMLTAQASIEDHVQCSINEQVAAQRLELEATHNQVIADLSSRFQAALATAAVGINRGFFASHSNPVRQALISAMTAAGIRDPYHLVDAAFEKHSDTYNKNLVAKASEILDLDVAVQNQLTDAVASANYLPTQGEGVAPIGTPVAAPVEATVIATASAQPVKPSDFNAKLNLALKF